MQTTGLGHSRNFSTEEEGRGLSLVPGKDLVARKQALQECIPLGRFSCQTDSVCRHVMWVLSQGAVFMRSSSLLLLT